jgi:hypothetical protein
MARKTAFVWRPPAGAARKLGLVFPEAAAEGRRKTAKHKM